MPSRNSRGALLPDLAAPALLLTTPFVIFLRHAGYALLSPEALTCLGSLALAGVVIGFVARGLGNLARVPLIALFVLVFVDLQRDEIGAWDGKLAAAAALLLVLAFLLRRHLAALVSVVCGTLLLSSLLLPVDFARAPLPTRSLPPPRTDLPPVVHLLLDEQIGVEGLRRRFDPDGAYAEALLRFYRERGFRVAGRAYAISTSSLMSISNLLNFNADARLGAFSRGSLYDKKITENAYFEAMGRRGYRIHVYQSDYMDYCRGDAELPIASCQTYELETARAIEGSELATFEKAKLIAGMYARLSFMIEEALTGYQRSLQQHAGLARWLPAWRTVGRVSPVSVMPVLEQLQRDLERAEPGAMYFAHLMLPHYPYAYDERCALRPDTAGWLSNKDPSLFPLANTPESQAERYVLYLEQMTCTHRKLAELFEAMARGGRFDASLVIVHGDHGSRILQAPMDVRAEAQIEPADYLDAYSTLFAVKPPQAAGSSTGEAPAPAYDDRLLPISLLLEEVVRDARPGDAPPWPGPPTVYLSSGGKTAPEPRPLPDFAAGMLRAPQHQSK